MIVSPPLLLIFKFLEGSWANYALFFHQQFYMCQAVNKTGLVPALTELRVRSVIRHLANTLKHKCLFKKINKYI